MAQKTIDIKELMTRKNPPVVKAGMYENVTVKSYELMESNGSQFYRFTFKLADGREISDNRFPQGLGIMISHLREQLKLDDVEISGTELFEKCKTEKFTIWVEKTEITNNMGFQQRVTNIHFLKPLEKKAVEDSTEEIVDDEMPE